MSPKLDRKDWPKPPPFVRPDSLWLVVYECRYDVIRVSHQGDGFFAPGQDVLWGFSSVTEWVREIVPPGEEAARAACPRCGC